MRRRARQWWEVCHVRPTRCSAILVFCSVRDWTRFLRHRILKYPDSPVHALSDSLRIYFFPLWRADLFFSGFDVEFAGCVWTVAISGKKNLRIRKISGYVWTGPELTGSTPSTEENIRASFALSTRRFTSLR